MCWTNCSAHSGLAWQLTGSAANFSVPEPTAHLHSSCGNHSLMRLIIIISVQHLDGSSSLQKKCITHRFAARPGGKHLPDARRSAHDSRTVTQHEDELFDVTRAECPVLTCGYRYQPRPLRHWCCKTWCLDLNPHGEPSTERKNLRYGPSLTILID